MRYLTLFIGIVISPHVFCQNVGKRNADKPEKEIVDTNAIYALRWYPVIRERSLDSLALLITDTNSIQIIPFINQDTKSEWYSIPSHFTDDTGEWIRKEHLEDNYLIYITNVSSFDLVVMSAGRGHAFIIQQEAKDKKGKWRGIETEYNGEGCGMVIGPMIIKSKKVYSTYAKKYPGDFETEVRLKLLVYSPDGSEYPKYIYSKPFKMKIDSTRLEKKFYSTHE